MIRVSGYLFSSEKLTAVGILKLEVYVVRNTHQIEGRSASSASLGEEGCRAEALGRG
jgi:hypothetical protein